MSSIALKDKAVETIVLGGGCFWCTEAVFLQLKGVKSVMPGYAGGHARNPAYDEVSSGTTGHAEAIKIEYDPAVIPFRKLLEVFFASHDPTTPNRQGTDVGSQYRSIILYTSQEQRQAAEAMIAQLTARKKYPEPIVTEIQPLGKFFPAEQYHKNFYARNPDRSYSEVVIAPKVENVRREYGDVLNNP